MNKQEFQFLEKVFEAEINNTQFHSKSKIAKKLMEDGYIREVIEKRNFPPLGVAEFKYLVFTPVGHMNFCYECDKYYDDKGNLK